jgi:hypothetical protein
MYVHTYTHIHTYIKTYIHIHTYIHPYIHTYTSKMAEVVGEQIENALNLIVSTTDQSGNIKKELKKTIFGTVSNLRTLFKLRASGDSKTSEVSKLTEQVTKLEAQLQQGSGTQARGHRTPSIAGDTVLAAMTVTEHGTPSSASCLEPAGKVTRCMALPAYRVGKLYAAAVKETKEKLTK